MSKSKYKNFYTLTREDPLFAAEGLDIYNAHAALDRLESITKKLEIIDQTWFGRVNFFIQPLVKTLHPFRFLNHFLFSEKRRRFFLSNPNFKNANELVKSYFRTVDALEDDLYSFKQACLFAQRKSRNSNKQANFYNFYTRQVSFVDFIICIDLMLKNTAALRSEIEKRKRLLYNEELKNDMMQTIISLDDREKQKEGDFLASLKEKRVDVINKELLQWIVDGRDFTYYIEKEYGELSIELYGPIYYTLSQFDNKPTTHQFYISLLKDSANVSRYFFPILLDSLHFIPLEKDKYSFYADIFTYQSLIDRNIPYWYQPASAYYFTSDSSYYADLATSIEKKKRPFLNQSLLQRQKSSMLDTLLWNGYYHNLGYYHNIHARVKAGKKISAWHYLLIGRSYPSLYFLSFNESVWRLKEKPNFLGRFNKQAAKFYISLEDIPKNIDTSTLKKIFYGGRIRAQAIEPL